jgi:hypothetical protein
MQRGIVWSFVVPITLCAGFAPPPQDPVAPAKDGFVLEPGDHQVGDLIDRAAKFLGRNYLLGAADQPRAPGTDTVHLQTRLELDARGCEQVVSQLAYSVGLVMTPVDPARGVWEWINVAGPRRGELMNRALSMTPEEVRRNSAWKVYVTTQVSLRQINPQAAMNSLRPFLHGNNNQLPMTVGNVGNAPTLLFAGFADQVSAVLRMVELAEEAALNLPPPAQEWQGTVESRLQALEKAVRELRDPAKK